MYLILLECDSPLKPHRTLTGFSCYNLIVASTTSYPFPHVKKLRISCTATHKTRKRTFPPTMKAATDSIFLIGQKLRKNYDPTRMYFQIFPMLEIFVLRVWPGICTPSGNGCSSTSSSSTFFRKSCEFAIADKSF